MTERPDLFAAVVSGVGWHNPLRYIVEPNGYGEEPEWGAISDPAGYRAVKSIDSFQAVIDGTLVNGSWQVVGWISRVVRRVQTDYVFHYALVMILGIFVLMTYFVLLNK